MARDDFTQKTKDILGRRVNFLCSNPCCRRTTCGPQSDPLKSTNIGVAAHIAAAAEGGPRFDRWMEPSKRASITNGIWLCQNCSKLIDNDPSVYTVEKMIDWKKTAEAEAASRIEKGSSILGDGKFPFLTLGEASKDSWIETESPHPPGYFHSAALGTDFFRNLRLEDLAAYSDLSLDIVFRNTEKADSILSEVGIEIVSISHHMVGYGDVQARKIVKQESIVLTIPDIKGEFMVDPRLLQPTTIKRSLWRTLKDPYLAGSGDLFRYELHLENYVDNMPNYAVLRVLVKTDVAIIKSQPIHVFTL